MPWFPTRRLLAAGLLAMAVSGCSDRAAAPDATAPAGGGATSAKAPASAQFVDVVWRVKASPQVQAGTLYVFLSTGTLIIDTPGGTPASGGWSAKDGTLDTMVEEGITYPVEVLSLDAKEFRIRMQNPGEPVEMTLERAEGGS